MTRMSTFEPEESPDDHAAADLPVMPDLVTDVCVNYTKAREIPSFSPDPSDQARASSG